MNEGGSAGVAAEPAPSQQAVPLNEERLLKMAQIFKAKQAKLLTEEQALSGSGLVLADDTMNSVELLRMLNLEIAGTRLADSLVGYIPPELQRAIEEKREGMKRLFGALKLPSPWTVADVLQEQERFNEEACERRAKELMEGFEDISQLPIDKRIELRLLRLRKPQRNLRRDVLTFMHRTRNLEWSNPGLMEGKKRKRQTLKELRALEKQESRQRRDFGRSEQYVARLELMAAILNNLRDIQNRARSEQQRQARIAKAVQQFHQTAEREEQKRLERLSKERIRALKADDEEGYRKLLNEQKDTRLTYLLRQTDEFLSGLMGKLVDQRADVAGESGEVGDEEGGVDYYAAAHRIQETVTEQPKMLSGGNLKEYQLHGLQWMLSLFNNRLNGILADEMGLGKTVQTIALLALLMERKAQNGPYLIVVPLSTLANWSIEFSRWAPSINVLEYRGEPAARKHAAPIIKSGAFNVLLTTYEYIIKDRGLLSKPRWLYIIVDEGHRMKNTHSKLAMTLSNNYHSRHRLILTGTPLQNSLPELWALLNFILPRIFDSSRTFEEWFNAPFAGATGERLELNEEETLLIIRRLHKVLRPFLLRRLKKDVESELPEKQERVVRCPMSSLQQRLYAAVAAGLDRFGTGLLRRFNNAIMQLRKICNHPFVFEEVEQQVNPTRRNNALLWRVSGKFELLARLLPRLRAAGHRVLIFFQMTQIMTIAEDLLNLLGLAYLRLDGSTKSEERAGLLSRFNAPDSPHGIFLLSTRAGGLGLNLQTADTVIIFDSDWVVFLFLRTHIKTCRHRIVHIASARLRL